MKKAELILNLGYIIAMLVCAYWLGKYFGNRQGLDMGYIYGIDTIYERLYKDTKREYDRLLLDMSSCVCPSGGYIGGEVKE